MKRKKPARLRNSTHTRATAPAGALLPLGAMMLAGLSLHAYADTPAAAAQDEPVLAPVQVEDEAEGGQDGYRATATRVGKTLQDPHDVPQAVTTVTRTLMDEQKASSLREALRNVSGLTFNAAEGGRSGDNMMLRGFYTFGDIYLDGIRDTAQYNREVFNLEQVDVLRGSAAMLFGRGQAGGVINQVSKVPFLADRGKVTASIGSNDYSQITGDLNQRLGETTALRLNLMKRDEGSWRNNPASGDEPELHRDGIAPSIGFGLGTDNEFILSHVLTRTDDIPDYGLRFNNDTREPITNFSASTFWGTDRHFDESETNISTATTPIVSRRRARGARSCASPTTSAVIGPGHRARLPRPTHKARCSATTASPTAVRPAPWITRP